MGRRYGQNVGRRRTGLAQDRVGGLCRQWAKSGWTMMTIIFKIVVYKRRACVKTLLLSSDERVRRELLLRTQLSQNIVPVCMHSYHSVLNSSCLQLEGRSTHNKLVRRTALYRSSSKKQ